MKIIELKTNHLETPLGFTLENPRLSWKVVEAIGKKQKMVKIEIANDQIFSEIIFSVEDESISSLAYELPSSVSLKPRTRYYWRVTVETDAPNETAFNISWFETGKLDEPWQANWIVPSKQTSYTPIFKHEVVISKQKEIAQARVYMCGLGLYELSINNKKIGDEYLTPGYHAYNHWLQYQTYEVNDLINGRNNIEILMGDGWYKGKFGFGKGLKEGNLYGEDYQVIFELRITYKDGSEEIIVSDESWHTVESQVMENGIYYGESIDLTHQADKKENVLLTTSHLGDLEERVSPPIKVKEQIKPIEKLTTPKGEIILDMGQNMVGWLSINLPLMSETHNICFEFSEVLQDGNFYRDNLNFAEAQFKIKTNGDKQQIRPHFTFYGFRYVRVTGWENIELSDVVGEVIYSDLQSTSTFECSNPLVTQLYQNALWSQKGNFLDTPTDCPQRSERLGWTGDAQIFADTACYNMDSYAFFQKYGIDLHHEQKTLNGSVPFIVPIAYKEEKTSETDLMVPREMSHGSTGWGEAATIIPWKVWLHYGDKNILKNQYQSMKDWVDYIYREDEKDGSKRLWQTGFHFGDWLGMDNYTNRSHDERMGGTDEYFVASVYYYYSTLLVSKAACILEKHSEAIFYENLAKEIKNSIKNEYVSPNGRLTVQTQTGLVLALYTEVLPESMMKQLVRDLVKLIKESNYHLTTGFIGTPYICLVLSKYGYSEIAYRLLLNEDLPSWLYQIKMGATTIWERWNSITEDGKMNPKGMNSLNHYAYGAIVEWLFKCMLGIQPIEDYPGYTKIKIAPELNYRIDFAKGSYNSSIGMYKVSWEILETDEITFNISIPFNAEADIYLPRAKKEVISKQTNYKAVEETGYTKLTLPSGEYSFTYLPTEFFRQKWSKEDSIEELLSDKRIVTKVSKVIPQLIKESELISATAKSSLESFLWHPFLKCEEDLKTDLIDYIESLYR